jgi:hypothetical protein
VKAKINKGHGTGDCMVVLANANEVEVEANEVEANANEVEVEANEVEVEANAN